MATYGLCKLCRVLYDINIYQHLIYLLAILVVFLGHFSPAISIPSNLLHPWNPVVQALLSAWPMSSEKTWVPLEVRIDG